MLHAQAPSKTCHNARPTLVGHHAQGETERCWRELAKRAIAEQQERRPLGNSLAFLFCPPRSLSGCDSPATCCGDGSLRSRFLFCPSRFLRQADLPTSGRGHRVLAGRAIGANTPQGCKSRVYTLDLFLSTCTFYL